MQYECHRTSLSKTTDNITIEANIVIIMNNNPDMSIDNSIIPNTK